jgi:uncharacterized peroxidase-related enzyme
MSVVKLVEKDEATGKVELVFNAVEQQYGFVPNILKAIANCPDLLATFAPFWGGIYTSPVISARDRAIAALATARAHSCNYCVSHMSASAMKAGLTGVEIAATTLDGCNALASEREQLIVEYATTLTKDTGGVTDELRARLKAQFNDAELVNLTLVIGLYNLTGRFLRSLNVEVEDVFQTIPAATASA